MGKRKDPVGEDSPGKQKKKKSNAVGAADTPDASGASVSPEVKKAKKPRKEAAETPQAAQSVEDVTDEDDCEIKDRVEENAAAKGDVADKDAEPTHEEKGAGDEFALTPAASRFLCNAGIDELVTRVLCVRSNSRLLPQAYDLHKRIIEPFEGLSAEEALDRLSDPTVSMKLTLPSFRVSRKSPPRTFTFVGRKTFPRLLQRVKAGGRTYLRGHSGRGKSYLLAALACYLHTYEDQCGIVVYLLMSELIGNFEYLLEALLLAYARHPSKQDDVLASSTSEEELLDFCNLAAPVCLLDEMNELDNELDNEWSASTAETRGAARLWQKKFYVAGVSCASDNSTFQTEETKGSCLFLLNQPFDMLELCGWISAGNHFEQGDFHELLLYTGLIPQHLHNYVMKKRIFIEQMQDQMDLFIDKMGPKEEEAVWGVLGGRLEELESVTLDPELFFERPFGEGTLVTVLPFLEPKLRAVMEMKLNEDLRKQQREDFQRRHKVYKNIITSDQQQPIASLNGWLAESLTRNWMVLNGVCLGWTFASVKSYDDNRPVVDLALLSEEELKKGVLFLPTTWLAMYTDLHHVKLLEIGKGKTLEVNAVQISVSSWKRKKVKDPHSLWKLKAHQYWSRANCETKPTFTYILSNALTKDIGEGVSVKRFGDIDNSLQFLDDFKDPECEL